MFVLEVMFLFERVLKHKMFSETSQGTGSAYQSIFKSGKNENVINHY